MKFKHLIFFHFIFFNLNTHCIQAQCISGNCQNGNGIFLYPSGAKYTGDFKNGEIHGIGVCYYSDGSEYRGEWQHRYPHGKGIKTYPNGKKLNARWSKGIPYDASGHKISEDIYQVGSVQTGLALQTGCISGNCQNGTGTYAYAEGSRYEGSFVNNKCQGQGVFYYPDGSIYKGAFYENFPHGIGTLMQQDKIVSEGNWEQGEFIGSATIEGGQLGCIQGDCSNGQGTYVFKDAEAKYIGTFQSGTMSGKGTIYYKNGTRYTGNWSRGLFHGIGTLYQQDGIQITGNWENGEFRPSTKESKIPSEPSSQLIRPARIWALVIGVSTYTSMPPLRYTDDDAYRMFAYLQSGEGPNLRDHQIKLLVDEDATLSNIKNSLQEILSSAGPDDLVLIYFAGHGIKDAFLPVDFDGYKNMLPHSEIKKMLQSTRAHHTLLLADACHSGGLEHSDEEYSALYKSLIEPQSSISLLLSSKSEETSLESSGLRQGIFTHFLIRALKGEADLNNDHQITLSELYDFVYNYTSAYTGNRQNPLLKGNFETGLVITQMK